MDTDNPRLLCQDLNRKLFGWFLTRAGWRTLVPTKTKALDIVK